MPPKRPKESSNERISDAEPVAIQRTAEDFPTSSPHSQYGVQSLNAGSRDAKAPVDDDAEGMKP